MTVYFSPWAITVHFGSEDRPLSSWTVHFGSNDSPVWLKTVHFRTTVYFKNRTLSPFWTVHFGPDSWSPTFFINIDVTLLLDRPLSSLMAVKLSFFSPLFLIKPSTFTLLDFHPSWARVMAVQYSSFRTSSFILSDRPLFDFKTVFFRGPSTLDLIPFFKNHFYWEIIVKQKMKSNLLWLISISSILGIRWYPYGYLNNFKTRSIRI